jgi:branched-chain amino acid aminotransferase/4-amino-4-deoxychorismate lyase
MARGCAVLGLAAPDPQEARRLADGALQDAGLASGRAVVRLTLTAGSGRGLERLDPAPGRLVCSASPAPPPSPAPARLATVAVRRNDTSPASRLKALSYLDNILARREARSRGADEALMLNTHGEIACAAAANLFWIAEGRLFTPALDCGVLAGTMRARVMADAAALGVPVEETAAGPSALAMAEAVFLTNALIGVRMVAAIDGRTFNDHALASRLAALVD